jgi:hypothetical protein
MAETRDFKKAIDKTNCQNDLYLAMLNRSGQNSGINSAFESVKSRGAKTALYFKGNKKVAGKPRRNSIQHHLGKKVELKKNLR